MAENVVTELSVIQKMISAYTQGYDRNRNEYSVISKERASLSAKGASTVQISKKMEEIKVRAQIYLYAVKLLSNCKTFKDLEVARNYMMTTFNTFANRYRVGYEEYQNRKSSMTKTQSDSFVKELMLNFNNASFLKKVIEEINKTLTMKVSRGVTAPVVEEKKQEAKDQTSSTFVRKPIVSKQPTVRGKTPVRESPNFNKMDGVSEEQVVKRIEAINKEIYASLLVLGRLQYTKGEQYESVRMRVYHLGVERERIVAELTTEEIARYILSDTTRKESNLLRAYGIVKPEPYVLTKETYEKRMEELSIILSDLKFNGVKSKTFQELHRDDHKTDTYTLSLDIMKYSHERSDIIRSVFGEDKEMSDLELEISSLERTYSLHESFAAFRKKPGKISGHEKTRELFNGGRKTLSQKTTELNELLGSKLEDGPITIESFSPTYESEKKELAVEYNKVITGVLKYRNRSQSKGRGM